MDFDDLDEAEDALGPSMDEVREECLKNAMPDPIEHPAPEGANFAPRGRLKMLFMGSVATNRKVGQLQGNTIFKEVPNRDQYLDWSFHEGTIKQGADVHQNPEIAEMFRPFGPDFYSHWGWANYSEQNESWEGFDEGLEHLATHLKDHGPYDGICGFDQGACLALMAAAAAQEGHPGFQGKFRFLLLFSAHGPKELSDRGDKRPRSPLKIPAYLSWSENDIAWPFTGYEDAALYIHPDYRQVVLHEFGHLPPTIQKDSPSLKCLESFMDSMRYELPLKPIVNEETQALKDFWLPLSRSSPPALPPGDEKRIIIITDPLGMHGPNSDQILKDPNRPHDEMPAGAAIRVELLRKVRAIAVSDFEKSLEGILEGRGGSDGNVTVEGVEYLPEHADLQWHPKEHRVARWIDQEDEIVAPWKVVEDVASQLLGTMAFASEDVVGIVGIGTGGHVAREMARLLISQRSLMPVGLWLVVPPTISPSSDAPSFGALVNCPVRYLVPKTAIAGPPWRLELSTFGPFSHGAFEDPAGAVRMVVEEFLKTSSGD